MTTFGERKRGKIQQTKNKEGGNSAGRGKIRREQCPGNNAQVLSSEAIKLPQKFKINQLLSLM